MDRPLILELRKIKSNSAHYKWLYQVIYDGLVVAEKRSRKEYIACYITIKETKYREIKGQMFQRHIFEAPHYFGRFELIGKGDSAHVQPYAVAFTWAFLLHSYTFSAGCALNQLSITFKNDLP